MKMMRMRRRRKKRGLDNFQFMALVEQGGDHSLQFRREKEERGQFNCSCTQLQGGHCKMSDQKSFKCLARPLTFSFPKRQQASAKIAMCQKSAAGKKYPKKKMNEVSLAEEFHLNPLLKRRTTAKGIHQAVLSSPALFHDGAK